MTTKNIAKLAIAVALTLTTVFGSGVVADQMGFEWTLSAYANQCTSGSGGGC